MFKPSACPCVVRLRGVLRSIQLLLTAVAGCASEACKALSIMGIPVFYLLSTHPL